MSLWRNIGVGVGATLVYAVVYVLVGWAHTKTSHHYREIAEHPELETPAKRLMARMLPFLLVYATWGWAAEMALLARTSAPQQTGLACAFYFVASLILVLVVMGIVKAAFKVFEQFNAIGPEFIILFAVIGFIVFVAAPRANWPWRWMLF